MTHTTTAAAETALFVAQLAIQHLANWSGATLVEQPPKPSQPIARAGELLPWRFDGQFKPLELLFDQVKLTDRTEQTEKHYWAPIAIEDCKPPIPYPQNKPPDQAQLDVLKRQIKPVLDKLALADWQNPTLLMLILEKYASYISLDGSNVAFFDQVRATSAIAAALATDTSATHLSLVAGNLSGIQNFIYTISSDGALKSLRARSFYLELVTEEVVQQLLEELALPRTSVIYAGGGNLYLIAPTAATSTKVAAVHKQINLWLNAQFQGKVFLALACHSFELEKVADQRFAQEWDKANCLVNQQKTQKFLTQLDRLLEPRQSYPPCKVCHRDDVPENLMASLNRRSPNSPIACEICQSMFELGSELLDVQSIVRSKQKELSGAVHSIEFCLGGQQSEHVYYHLFAGERPIVSNPEFTFFINNWNLKNYQFSSPGRVAPLLLGQYYKAATMPDEQGEIRGFIRAEEMAAQAEGIKRVGYLRMDVDRLGQIFAKGLDEGYSLPKLAGLSRQMSYFFKVYLNGLAGDRQTNFLNHFQTHAFQALTSQPQDDSEKHLRKNLLFIYAGGDDLFVSGSWDEIVEFAFDVYQSFRAYTGNHPDITLSGGISIEGVKFPLYQAADAAGEAEDAAKGNDRDSLGLFGRAFKWSEWLGADQQGQASEAIALQFKRKESESNYWQKANLPAQPPLLGILPFVTRLRLNFSRSFIRNLLIAAELQEQRIKDIKEKRKQEEYTHYLQDIQYYLHLPQIAYALSRLPRSIREDPSFEPIRTSLKSPYNAPYFRAIATWIELLSRSP